MGLPVNYSPPEDRETHETAATRGANK